MDTTLMTYMREQLAFVKLDFKRYLYAQLPWEARLVGLMGPRGVGKSTMILQHISEQAESKKSKSLYVIYTPKASNPHMSPCAHAPGNERSNAKGFKDDKYAVSNILLPPFLSIL